MEFRKGERQFIQKLSSLTAKEEQSSEKNREQINIEKNNLLEKIHHTIEKIKNELETMQEISREAEFHPDQKQIIEQYKDILAQAIDVSLNEDLLKGFQIIKKTKNPWLYDAFHAIMADHFYNLLKDQDGQ